MAGITVMVITTTDIIIAIIMVGVGGMVDTEQCWEWDCWDMVSAVISDVHPIMEDIPLAMVMRLLTDMHRLLQRLLFHPLFTFNGRMSSMCRLRLRLRITGTIAAIRKAIIPT